MTCLRVTWGSALWLNRIVFAALSSLGKQQPSGFQGADRLIRCDGLPPRTKHTIPLLPGEHCALCWWARRAPNITFPAEAGSENWRVPVTRPLLSSWSYTEPNSNHVCSHPVDLGLKPARLAGWQVLWSSEQHVISGNIQPLPLAIVIWIPPLYNSTGVSWGKW